MNPVTSAGTPARGSKTGHLRVPISLVVSDVKSGEGILLVLW